MTLSSDKSDWHAKRGKRTNICTLRPLCRCDSALAFFDHDSFFDPLHAGIGSRLKVVNLR